MVVKKALRIGLLPMRYNTCALNEMLVSNPGAQVRTQYECLHGITKFLMKKKPRSIMVGVV